MCAVRHFERRDVPLEVIQAITIHVEQELADKPIDTFEWKPYPNGPRSPDLERDVLLASHENWSYDIPLGGQENITFDGTRKYSLYAIDSTDKYLYQWFKNSKVTKEEVLEAISEVLKKYQSYSGFCVSNAIEEAIKYDQEFENKYYI